MGPETLEGAGEGPTQALSLWPAEIGSSPIISFLCSWFTHQGGEQSRGMICREFLSELFLAILSYMLRNSKHNQSVGGRKSDTAFQKPNGNECEDCDAITLLLLVYYLNEVPDCKPWKE